MNSKGIRIPRISDLISTVGDVSEGSRDEHDSCLCGYFCGFKEVGLREIQRNEIGQR